MRGIRGLRTGGSLGCMFRGNTAVYVKASAMTTASKIDSLKPSKPRPRVNEIAMTVVCSNGELGKIKSLETKCSA